MTSDYVFHGLWRNYNLAYRHSWVWTITNIEAVALLGSLTIFLGIVQSRAWTILRYIMNRMTTPLHPDILNPDSVDNLTQSRAIVVLVQYWKSRRRRQRLGLDAGLGLSQPAGRMTTISPWFGVASLVSVIIFLALGVVIPVVLTEGVFSPAEVKSRLTDHCFDLSKDGVQQLPFLQNIEADQLPYTLYQQCYAGTDSYCNPPFGGFPDPVIDRTDECPLDRSLCRDGSKTLVLVRPNMTAYDFGINANIPITYSHRVACAPIGLDPFIRSQDDRLFMSIQDMASAERQGWWDPALALGWLLTTNANGTGPLALLRGQQAILQILPRDELSIFNYSVQDLHPLLQRSDGHPFIMTYQGGHTLFMTMVDDPIFSAHFPMAHSLIDRKMVNETDALFAADQEVTGLGCVEQFQFCVATPRLAKCYPWSTMFEPWQQVYDDLVSIGMDNNTALVNLARLLPPLGKLSVRKYLIPSSVPPDLLISRLRVTSFNVVLNMDPNEQWVQEVQAWFQKAMLLMRVLILKIAQNELAPGQLPLNPIREYSLCGLVLFLDGDYTNIDWIGMWITFAVLIFVCIASSFVPGQPGLAQAMSQAGHCIWVFTKQRAEEFWRAISDATHSSWEFVKRWAEGVRQAPPPIVRRARRLLRVIVGFRPVLDVGFIRDSLQREASRPRPRGFNTSHPMNDLNSTDQEEQPDNPLP